jgi:hypothetical protein
MSRNYGVRSQQIAKTISNDRAALEVDDVGRFSGLKRLPVVTLEGHLIETDYSLRIYGTLTG